MMTRCLPEPPRITLADIMAAVSLRLERGQVDPWHDAILLDEAWLAEEKSLHHVGATSADHHDPFGLFSGD